MNIDTVRKVIRFLPEKAKARGKQAELEIPFHPDVEDYLLSLPVKPNCPNDPIFPTLNKKRVTGDQGLSNLFIKLMRKASIHRESGSGEVKGKGRQVFTLGYHSFRHTSISEMANHGVSKERRMRLSGHKSNVHERYTHHELETLRQEVERVPSFVQPRKP